jgi:hypothetical protein
VALLHPRWPEPLPSNRESRGHVAGSSENYPPRAPCNAPQEDQAKTRNKTKRQ